jgi:hypothetical protein
MPQNATKKNQEDALVGQKFNKHVFQSSVFLTSSCGEEATPSSLNSTYTAEPRAKQEGVAT